MNKCTWYWYKSGGWIVAVDAMNIQDARQYLSLCNPGRDFEYFGNVIPPTTPAEYSTATAMTTPRRQEEISRNLARGTLL